MVKNTRELQAVEITPKALKLATARSGKPTTSVIKCVSEKHRLFIKEMAKGNNMSGAARVCGFTYQNAQQLMKQDHIKQAIRVEQNKYERTVNMTRKRVMDGFLKAIQNAELQSDSLAMISGWREIGKMCGYYEPKKINVNINHSGEVALKTLSQLSDAELLKIAESGNIIEGELVEDAADGSEPDSAYLDDLEDDDE